MILSQDQTLVDFCLIFNVRNSSDVSVKTEVLTYVVRILYELTHGPTYLVFKYQLSNRFRPSLHLRSETTDYTEAIIVVNRTRENL